MRTLSVLALTVLLSACSEQIFDADKIQNRNGIAYLPNQEIPLTGRAASFHKNGQKKWDRTYKDGKKEGTHTQWYSNGQKEWEGTYKDGRLVGNVKWWDQHGTVIHDGPWRDKRGAS